jgi:hypothetical protein
VPEHLALDDHVVGVRVEPGAHGGSGLVGDGALDLLPLAVARVEGLGDGQRLGVVAGEEEAEGIFGGFEAAGGVETGGKLEADVLGAEQGWRLGDLFKGDETGALGGVEALEADGGEDAVFAGEGDDVGDGAEGDEVEEGAEVEVGGAGETGFAGAFEESVGEFEGEAG